jgi:hyperosmotically inducible periplasmic protein
MNRKAIAMLAALALVPLAGCEMERDAEGKAQIHIEGEKVERELEQAGEQLERGADQVQRSAEQVGATLKRGAERVEAEVGPVLDDASITARIKAKLIADPEVNSFHIDVDTVDGRVALNGKVASQEQREEAEDLARGTAGVRHVVNLIQVAGQPPPAGG